MAIPLLRGAGCGRRRYSAGWVDPAPGQISPFADQMFPNQDPIGREFFIAFGRLIVGVVGNIQVRGLERQRETLRSIFHLFSKPTTH